MYRKQAIENFYMVKEAAKRNFDYDKDKLKLKTQQAVGRTGGYMLGTLGGVMLGKTPKGILAKGIGGGLIGAGAGHYLGPKGIKVEDRLLDHSVRGALLKNDKKAIKDLKENYNLKVHKNFKRG